MKNPERTLGKFINHRRICYFGTFGLDSYPHIKAMLAPRKRNGIKEFFLSTNVSSNKVKALRENNKACLYFANTFLFRGLMLEGMVEILEDQDSKTMLWEKGDEKYYPEGVTDPDYCVLKFTATSARYYSHYESINLEDLSSLAGGN